MAPSNKSTIPPTTKPIRKTRHQKRESESEQEVYIPAPLLGSEPYTPWDILEDPTSEFNSEGCSDMAEMDEHSIEARFVEMQEMTRSEGQSGLVP